MLEELEVYGLFQGKQLTDIDAHIIETYSSKVL